MEQKTRPVFKFQIIKKKQLDWIKYQISNIYESIAIFGSR